MADLVQNAAGMSQQWEMGLANLGMGAPSGRFIAGTLAGMIAVWAIRPEIAFSPDGSAKDWELTGSGQRPQTSIPWWGMAAIPGVIFATFF